ncbi:hypothetical protein GCM10023345_04110 [Acinetobacter kookii]
MNAAVEANAHVAKICVSFIKKYLPREAHKGYRFLSKNKAKIDQWLKKSSILLRSLIIKMTTQL